MRDKFLKFMYGRYGVDELGKTMLLSAIVLSFLGMIINLFKFGFWFSFICSTLSTALMIHIIYRAFSKNINKRVLENHKFLAKTEKILCFRINC